MKFETLNQIAQRIIQTEVHGTGIESLTDYPGKIAAVQGADILRCAREHVDFKNLIITIVGRAKAISPDFERFGPVEVWE
jgi:predicted Zn-dependent peptidase